MTLYDWMLNRSHKFSTLGFFEKYVRIWFFYHRIPGKQDKFDIQNLREFSVKGAFWKLKGPQKAWWHCNFKTPFPGDNLGLRKWHFSQSTHPPLILKTANWNSNTTTGWPQPWKKLEFRNCHFRSKIKPGRTWKFDFLVTEHWYKKIQWKRNFFQKKNIII